MPPALLALGLLLGGVSARAQEVSTAAFARLQDSPDVGERVLACAELAAPPNRGPRAFQALVAAMGRDLSQRVRLAAAVAVGTYKGGETLSILDSFLKSEPGAEVRRDVLIALSTEPAHFDNPDATRLIASFLADDPSPDVRRGAAVALGARSDALAVGATRKASEQDADKGVREAATAALKILSQPPKPKPKPKAPAEPKIDAVFGKDPCPPPWGWCACSGAIKLKPKCMTTDECRSFGLDMHRRGLTCAWDGASQD